MLSRRQGETDRYRARDMRHTKSHNNSTLQTKTSPPHNLETPRPLAMEAEQEQRTYFLLIFSKMDGNSIMSMDDGPQFFSFRAF